MKKIFFIFLFFVCSLSIFSATNLYGGSTHTWDFSNYADNIISIEYYIDINDTTGLNFEVSDSKVNLIVDLLYDLKPFNITFAINGENYYTESVGGGGSSSHKKVEKECYKGYTCSSWGECINGVQRRNCVEILNKCFENESLMLTLRSCKDTEILEKETNVKDFCDLEENCSENKEKKSPLIIIYIILSLGGILLLTLFYIKYRQSLKRRKTKQKTN